MRVDTGGQRRGVGNFQRDVTLPAGFQRCDIYNQTAARISTLAQANHQHILGNSEIFHRVGEHKAVRRYNTDIGVSVNKTLRGESFRIDKRVIDIGENLEIRGAASIIAVRGQAIGNHAVAFLLLFEGLDHLLLTGQAANLMVGQKAGQRSHILKITCGLFFLQCGHLSGPVSGLFPVFVVCVSGRPCVF